jgi:hypothetical protein
MNFLDTAELFANQKLKAQTGTQAKTAIGNLHATFIFRQHPRICSDGFLVLIFFVAWNFLDARK